MSKKKDKTIEIAKQIADVIRHRIEDLEQPIKELDNRVFELSKKIAGINAASIMRLDKQDDKIEFFSKMASRADKKLGEFTSKLEAFENLLEHAIQGDAKKMEETLGHRVFELEGKSLDAENLLERVVKMEDKFIKLVRKEADEVTTYSDTGLVLARLEDIEDQLRSDKFDASKRLEKLEERAEMWDRELPKNPIVGQMHQAGDGAMYGCIKDGEWTRLPITLELQGQTYKHAGSYKDNTHLFFDLVDAIILDGEVYIKTEEQ